VDSRVRRTIERMEEQLHRRLAVTELAAAAGLSVAQLTRLFRQTTGCTPGAYLQALRMQRARILVERTSLPVTEVMVQVGIFDRSHFTRAFCRVHGVGPRTLRVQLRCHERPRLTCDEMRIMASTVHSSHVNAPPRALAIHEKQLKGKD
jgi:transcriptional regulator GlxA family with amidase domain